jgi:hypothetical protein
MQEKGSAFYKAIFDSLPIMIFLVDEDVRCIDFNKAAEEGLRLNRSQVLNVRGGEVLQCLNARESPEGCGRGSSCKNCVIRNSVKESRSGSSVVRKRMHLEYFDEGQTKKMEILVTANAMEFDHRLLTILALEDVSEMTKLRDIVPICAKCKKVRNDKHYWQSVEEYFSNSVGVDFTHGLCPKCLSEVMPGNKGERDQPSKGET